MRRESLPDLSSLYMRVAQNVVWPALAAVCLVLAGVVPWVAVPLVSAYRAWDLPFDIGWGFRSPQLSYGVLTLVAAAGCVAYAARRTLAVRQDQETGGETHPQPQALLALALLAMSPALLLVVQETLIDFGLVTTLAEQENESLLIRANLGYQILAQHFAMRPFQVVTGSVADRLILLIQLAGFGAVLPFIAGALLVYGAYRIQRSGPDSLAEVALFGSPRMDDTRRVVRWAMLAAVIIVILILGRASLALIMTDQGDQALALGDYQSALVFYQRAQWLNGLLVEQPKFREHRGQALFVIGQDRATDAQLYRDTQMRIVAQVSALNDLRALEQRNPSDLVMRYELITTLEMQSDASGLDRLLLAHRIGSSQTAGLAIRTATANSLLPYLDELTQIQPDDPYAHYVRGRLLFAERSYEAAASDFEVLLGSTSDNDMRSAAYTYLAFCRGGVGDYVGERTLLLEAVKLDHGYYNTTAREATSGLL